MSQKLGIIQAVKETLWALAQLRRSVAETKCSESLNMSVTAIINNTTSPDTKASEIDYNRLATTYSGPGEYGYGDRQNWLRGIGRAKQIIEAVPSLTVGNLALEVGCGDGMTAVALRSFGIEVHLTDLKDWRDPRANGLPFIAIDLGVESTPLSQGPYDLIYSYNAFEHFPDPQSVLIRMLAHLKPGGHLFFEFGPLYCGPWGLHAYRMLPMPYPQFIFSELFWRSKIKESGVRDLGQELEDLQPLNRWTVRQFDDLWATSHCEILRNDKYKIEQFIDVVVQYPDAFRGRGLTYEDLTTQGLCVLLRKPL